MESYGWLELQSSTIHNKQSNSNYLAQYDIRLTILYKENI